MELARLIVSIVGLAISLTSLLGTLWLFLSFRAAAFGQIYQRWQNLTLHLANHPDVYEQMKTRVYAPGESASSLLFVASAMLNYYADRHRAEWRQRHGGGKRAVDHAGYASGRGAVAVGEGGQHNEAIPLVGPRGEVDERPQLKITRSSSHTGQKWRTESARTKHVSRSGRGPLTRWHFTKKDGDSIMR